MLHIITRFIRGGADENTLLTVNGLDSSRYEVHLMIGNTYDERMIGRLSPSVRLIKIKEMGREISPVKDLEALLSIYRIIREEKYHILHTHTSKAGFLGRLAARLAGTAHIIHGVHTIPFADVLQPQYNGFFLLLEKFAASFTHLFIAVGEDLKRRYIEAGVGAPERYRTVYSGMDLEEFNRAAQMDDREKKTLRSEIGITDGEMCVGIVSRLESGKGFNFFTRIIEEIVRSYPHVRFIVVGDGSLKGQLTNEIAQRKLDDKVSFIGSREDIARIIATFDVAIFTSLLEGLPRTVVQYALLGKPIVTFDVGGVREVVSEGKNGFIVDGNNVEQFAERVSRILAEPQLARAMSLEERDFPRERWSKEEMVRRIDEIYRQLLGAP